MEPSLWAARLRTAVTTLAIALVATAEAQAEAPPAIAAASDLRFALDEVATAFTAETGQRLVISYGSSGNFLRQIMQGAPFELFLSADERFVFELAERGRSEGTGTLYAIGRLVLFAGTGSPVRVDAELADLAAAAADGRLRPLAIANPEHAPYGRAAEQVLRSQGLWDLVKPRLVLGENVSHAAQFATTGSAQAGIFAYALALAPAVSASTGRGGGGWCVAASPGSMRPPGPGYRRTGAPWAWCSRPTRCSRTSPRWAT